MDFLCLILDASRVFTLPTTPSNKTSSHVCSRHGRERRKVLDEKPVKPARSIQPKAAKPVRQACGKLDALIKNSSLSKTVQEKSVTQAKNKAEVLVSAKTSNCGFVLNKKIVKKKIQNINW